MVSIAIPNAQSSKPGLLPGGQPSEEHLRQASEAGYCLIINTRGHGEPGTDVEPQIVAELGLEYLHIPMAGPGDVTLENAQRMASALKSAV